MANLINATVYQIDGNPKDTSVVIAFDTNNIVVQAATVSTISAVNSFIEVKGAKLNAPPIRYYVGETVTALVALANTNGTTLVQATIASINDNPQKVNIQVALPANKVQIVAFSSGDINSYLQYGNDKYYATETKSTLVTAANTSSGGGGGVQTVTGFGVDNTDPLNPIIVAPYNYYLASVSQSSTIAPTVNSSTKTFPATITLARAAGGFYTITASAATFTANKTLVTITGTGSGGYADVKFFTPQVSSTTVINFGTARIDGTFDDGFEATIQVIILP